MCATPKIESPATVSSAGSAGRRSRAWTKPIRSRVKIPPPPCWGTYGGMWMRAISTAAVIEVMPKMQKASSKWRVASSGAERAGPSMRVRLLAADCSETALGRSRIGTVLAATA